MICTSSCISYLPMSFADFKGYSKVFYTISCWVIEYQNLLGLWKHFVASFK